MNAARRSAVFRALKKANPAPATELEYGSPFELLVAVVLSAQATDVSVNKVTSRLFAVANTPAAMLRLGLTGLKRHIRSIGLYNTKARNIMRTSRILIEEHGGAIPQDRTALESLPGVGRKTANVILNTAFGVPVIAVDTHIFRVSNRTGLARGKNVREVEDRLMRVVPREFRKNAHHWLILHGRYTCTARAPYCDRCAIYAYCEWKEKSKFRRETGKTAGTRRLRLRGQRGQGANTAMQGEQ